MWLNIEHIEHQPYPMAGRRGKVPDAILLRWIVIRIVGAEDLAVRCKDFVLAATLLAIVPIVVQRVPVPARAHVRADRVFALLLAPAIVDGTLIDVGKVNGGKARLLDRLIGLEHHPQDVPLGRNRCRHGVATVRAVLVQRTVRAFRQHRHVVVLALGRLVEGVALQVEVGKVERDFVLRQRHYLPHALLHDRVLLREGRR